MQSFEQCHHLSDESDLSLAVSVYVGLLPVMNRLKSRLFLYVSINHNDGAFGHKCIFFCIDVGSGTHVNNSEVGGGE